MSRNASTSADSRARSQEARAEVRYGRRVPWMDVARSEDLVPAGRLTVSLADRDVVVWRTQSGRLAAADARCPHQWAHLGATGIVDGEVLVCPSHGWCFEADGAGFKRSASGRRDEKASVDTVAVREIDGIIEIDTGDRPAGGVAHTEVHRP